MTLRNTLLCGVVFTVFGSVGSVAVAQTAPAPAPAPAQQASTVGEIIVVARKRAENLQSVPVAVTAQTGTQLQQQGVREPTDLGRIVPSLTVVSGASSPTGALTSLRGQTASDVLLTLSQPVGLYEDSVNIPHPAGSDLGFFDLTQVEVLNGPQGTLYGRNTTGGAINIFTRGADYNGYHGFVSGEAGNYDDWKVGGAVNVPIVSDTLAVRLAYQHWNREGFGDSAVTGERLGDSRDDDVGRLSVKFDPNPVFSASLKVEYDHATRTDDLYQTRELTPAGMFTTTTCAGGETLSGGGGQYCPQLNGTSFGGAFYATNEWYLEGMKGGVNPALLVNPTGSDNLFTNNSAIDTFEHVSAWHGALDMSWKITPDITLRSITGLHQFTDYRTFDLTGLPIQAFVVGYGAGGITPADGVDPRSLQPDEQSLQWTQEFNLSGEAFDRRLRWLVGGFYSSDSGSENERASLFEGLTATANGPFDINYTSPTITNKSWAVFSQDDFKINKIFSITMGGRYTEEDLSQVNESYIYLFPNGGYPAVYSCLASAGYGLSPGACALDQSLHSSGVSYLFSFNAQVTQDILLYAKTARGFRGGALQARAPQDPPARPETDTDYEVGVKSDWLDHRLRVNLDAYDTEYQNKQETQIVDINGAQTTPIVNAASARIQGVEGLVTAAPFEGLTLNGSFDYLYGKYLNFPTALTPDNVPADGTGVPFAIPRWTLDIGGRYVHSFGPGEIAFQADYSWHAATPETVLNVDPTLKAIAPGLVNSWYSAVGLVNARLEFNVPDKGLSIALFATNLLDKHYQVYSLAFVGSESDFGWSGQTQEPRMWGVTIRKSFGGD